MKIAPEQSQGPSPEAPNPAATVAKSERASTESSTASQVEKASTTAGAAVVSPIQRQTNVTFRRDNNGRIYYVVSDANSGQEILELPSKAVRDLGQGIDDYLNEQQSKGGGNSHVEVKA
jgi:uncharacterized FlaG/YvyC family protein